jgi:hypothetical protein
MALVVLLVSPARAADPALSLAATTLRLPPSKSDGEVRVLLKADNLAPAAMPKDDEAKVEDVGALEPGTTIVQFEPKGTLLHKDATSRSWLWVGNVSGLPPNSTQKRLVRLTASNLSQVVEYTLTNVLPGTFVWSVTGPGSPWIVWQGFPGYRIKTEVVLATGDSPATNVRLAHSSMRGALGLSAVELADVALCDTAGQCGIFSLPPRTSRTLFLQLQSPTRYPWTWFHGKYTGTLALAVDERPEVQALTVTLHASSWLAQLAGAILLMLGVGLWWWVNVWNRARLLRLEALRPVAVLRQQIAALRTRLGQAPDQHLNATTLDSTLAEIDGSLTTSALDDKTLLPPLPPGFGGDVSAALKEFLTVAANRVTGMSVVVRDGIEVLWRDWRDASGANAAAARQAVRDAVKQLDEQGARVANETQARELVKTQLAAYNNARATALHIAADSIPEPREGPRVTVQELNWEIGRLHKLGWLLWGVLTVLSGVWGLVLSNAGFGTAFDLLFCLFWGFGLPTTVEKLQQVAPSTIAASAGVTLPKAG